MREPLNPTWDLDAIFPGGSESPELAQFMEALQTDIAAFRSQVAAMPVPQTAADLAPLVAGLERQQDLSRRLRQMGAFMGCLTAQNVKDEQAKILGGQAQQIGAALASALTLMDSKLLEVPQPAWEALLADPRFELVGFNLNEKRRRFQAKMGSEREALVNDLSVDGYHAWGELYNTVVGRIQIPVGDQRLSVGQAANQMNSADREVRKAVFGRWEEAWGDSAELCASSLNHLAGYRINLYKHRGWESVLGEPLDNNRMQAETLNVMWDVIERNKQPLLAYMERKAQLLGVNGKLAWYDVDAPLSKATRKVTYEEAADFIIEHFGRFSPRMADFAHKAFLDRWIEAEDRPGKRPGGFCTSFPVSRQSRIFMTFGGNMGNVATLAHELGHAWHQAVMNDLPQLAQGYAMNVAETASTFAEMIVADAALKAAQSREERLAMLADKVERGIAFFMNIHARFIFETSFYAERRRGPVSVPGLNRLMETAQRKAYRDGLSAYHPLFWASKLHFYSTGQPFYNFPYTFGFLFSSGVYARAVAEGRGFEQKYVDLLRDTGRMTVEDLAARHLGADLTRPDFWQSACDLVTTDVNEFLNLTR
jgi:oligoendopeptidase F